MIRARHYRHHKHRSHARHGRDEQRSVLVIGVEHGDNIRPCIERLAIADVLVASLAEIGVIWENIQVEGPAARSGRCCDRPQGQKCQPTPEAL